MKVSFIFVIIQLLNSILNSESFVPAVVINKVVKELNKNYRDNLGEIGITITHDEITTKGIIRSVARYFYDRINGSALINLVKAANDEYSVKSLYRDYYGNWYCEIELEDLIKSVFIPNVVIVDFDSNTKKMPYAHFDSETFIQSSRRVMNFTNNIIKSILKGDHDNARRFSGQILHTIHDFYSHSNWVEAGNTKINADIGTMSFESQQIVGQNESACVSNCTLIEVQCNTFVSFIGQIANVFGLESNLIKCPLKFYQCFGNVRLLNKLVSGYSVNQKLPDGTSLNKPQGLMKCSHGGILDDSSFVEATGGINKDSGFYLFSPHAELHVKAAKLAIDHTEYFFNQIRKQIGDEKYNEFLGLELRNNEICAGHHLQASIVSLMISAFLITLSLI